MKMVILKLARHTETNEI